MERAIEQIRQLIQYHENKLEEWIEFISNRDEGHNDDEINDYVKETVIDNSRKVYKELIDELNQAILILQNTGVGVRD